MRINQKSILAVIAAAIITCCTFTACNSDVEYDYSLPSTATVHSFSLYANDSVLPHLDSVFFTIDLYSYSIFNADSLPCGTDISALQPMLVLESASVVEFLVTGEDGTDEVFNYMEDTEQYIDFNRPVKLHVVSFDGTTEVNYDVKVNVHKVVTDTLVWTQLDSGKLPTPFATVSEQHTAMSPDGLYYCLTASGANYAMAYTTDPAGTWNMATFTPTFTPQVGSLVATTDALYILDTEGNTYTSTDHGMSWSAVQLTADYLIGAYGSRLLATSQTSAGWSIVDYPSGVTTTAPADFPVINTSTATSVLFEMASSPQLIVTGGRTADGTLSGASWGYDGSAWARLSRTPLPEGLENLALTPYFDLKIDTVGWHVAKKTSVMLAMFGNRADGTPNDTIYMSTDFGMNWKKAPDEMQLPSTIASRTQAQVFPFTGVGTVAKARSSKVTETPFQTVAMRLTPTGTTQRKFVASRASTPITEWDIPYLFMFGGVNASGTTFNTVYRGVITELTFKPLQ